MLTAAAQAPPGVVDWKVIVPLIVAAIAFAGVMIKLWCDARSARRERLRELCAGGWAAVQALQGDGVSRSAVATSATAPASGCACPKRCARSRRTSPTTKP